MTSGGTALGQGWKGWLSISSEKLCSVASWKRLKRQNKLAKSSKSKKVEINRKESKTCISVPKIINGKTTGKGRGRQE